MSTNFYWLPIQGTSQYPTGENVEFDTDGMSPVMHIGLRAGAGAYCWDCKLTLCKRGESEIHSGFAEWHQTCPSCGSSKDSEYETEAGPDEESHGSHEGIGGRIIPIKRRGVGRICSFTWAQDPKRVLAICAAMEDVQIIRDEYGRKLTGKEFLDVLSICPVQYTDSIGQRFC